MANESILKAFERMWQHVITGLSGKSDVNHNHDDIYCTEAEVDAKLSSMSSSSHTHTVSQISDLTASATELNYVDGVTSNIQTQLDGKASSSHTHTIANVSNLQNSLDAKVPTSRTVNGKALNSNITLSASDVGADASGTAQTKADSALASAKTYTDEKVANLLNNSTEAVDSIMELATAMEENADVVSALESAVGNKVDKVSGKGLSTNDLTATLKSNYDTAYSHVSNKSNPHGVTLSQLGVNATATELNYVDGVTSSIQTQLDGKAASSHTHNYAGSSSAGGAATSANKLATARTIALNGRVSGSTSFDGSGNVTITTTDGQHISNKASGAYYFPLATMVADNASNYGNITITGRIGGWEQGNSANFEIMMLNRSSARDGNTITSTVSASGQVDQAFTKCDIVVYRQDDTSAKVYLKTNSYWLYDFDWSAYQHSVIYDGSKSAETPAGTLIWSLSTAPKTILSADGSLYATKFVGSFEGTMENATKATQDANGNVITDTYMTKVNPTGSGNVSIGRLSGTTIGDRSVVIGTDAEATNRDTVAIGYNTHAINDYGVAIGYSAVASGQESTAIGSNATASGKQSVSLGSHNTASGEYSLAAGCWTNSKGVAGTALGNGSTVDANSWSAVSSGIVTTARGLGQHVFGSYNIPDAAVDSYSTPAKHIIIVGNGDVLSDNGQQSNAFTIDWDGNGWFQGDVKIGGTSYDTATKTLATTDDITLSKLGVTATAAELNKMDGVTATATELNYMDGVTSNVQTQLDGKAASSHTHTKSQITDFPTSLKNPTSLTIQGNGTTLTNGVYDGSVAKTVNITPSAIGAAASSHTHAISDVTGLQTTLDGKAASSHTHTVSQISDLTATATELNYMDGVTSNVQTQIDALTTGKANASHTHDAATTSVAGFMSASDKAKLDSIEEGATAGGGGVGQSTTGTVYTINGASVTAAAGAEVFNQYTLNKASGQCSHAEGSFTTASGSNSHAEGGSTTASGSNSHAEGGSTTASGQYSHAEGYNTTAGAGYSHAEGQYTTIAATGIGSHVEGYYTKSSHPYQHVQGKYNATGSYAHIVGNGTSDTARSNIHTLDWNGNAWFKGDIYVGGTSQSDAVKLGGGVGESTGNYAERFNNYTSNTASGQYSHAEGSFTTASGEISHAEGGSTTASGQYSHAEGYNTAASASYSHAEGTYTVASGAASHAEGGNVSKGGAVDTSTRTIGNITITGTTASGAASHAEGFLTFAKGYTSHAEGYKTTASGEYGSHAEGYETTASGYYAHAEGRSTIAKGMSQHVQGEYNIEDTASTYAHIVGNGSSDTARSNAHTLDWQGNAWFAGDVQVTDGQGNTISVLSLLNRISALEQSIASLTEVKDSLNI